MYNKCELVFCTPVYHKHHLSSNLTNKGGNPLALFTDTCHTKTFDECNNSNTCVYAFMKFKLMLVNHLNNTLHKNKQTKRYLANQTTLYANNCFDFQVDGLRQWTNL